MNIPSWSKIIQLILLNTNYLQSKAYISRYILLFYYRLRHYRNYIMSIMLDKPMLNFTNLLMIKYSSIWPCIHHRITLVLLICDAEQTSIIKIVGMKTQEANKLWHFVLPVTNSTCCFTSQTPWTQQVDKILKPAHFSLNRYCFHYHVIIYWLVAPTF